MPSSTLAHPHSLPGSDGQPQSSLPSGGSAGGWLGRFWAGTLEARREEADHALVEDGFVSEVAELATEGYRIGDFVDPSL